jgi:invasion protein IalB
LRREKHDSPQASTAAVEKSSNKEIRRLDTTLQHAAGPDREDMFLTQTVIQTKDKKKPGLLAITVGLLGQDQKPGLGLRVPIGLGVLLPTGFKFNVPGIEPTRIVSQSCLPLGCIARLPLSPAIIDVMKKAEKGSLEVHTLRKQVVKLTVSFKGFAAALASLSKG